MEGKEWVLGLGCGKGNKCGGRRVGGTGRRQQFILNMINPGIMAINHRSPAGLNTEALHLREADGVGKGVNGLNWRYADVKIV